MIQSSVAKKFLRAARARVAKAKFFSALRALGLQKQNFLRAARARYQRKRVTQPSIAKNFLCAARTRVAKVNFSPRCARQIPEKTDDLV